MDREKLPQDLIINLRYKNVFYAFDLAPLCNVTRAGESVYVIRIKQKTKRWKSLAVP